MRRKAILCALCAVLLVPAFYGALVRLALSYEGSPREAQRQAEELGGELRMLLTDCRGALEALRAAAAGGHSGRRRPDILDGRPVSPARTPGGRLVCRIRMLSEGVRRCSESKRP